MARVVLPHEPNPARIEESLTVLIRGDAYNQAGRWQRLDLSRPTKLLRDQQPLLRDQLKHDVNFADAYVDRLVLNVNGGPGDNQVWIDNLEIGPVDDASPFKTTGRANPSKTSPLAPTPRVGSMLVELKRDGLRVKGKPYFFSGIRWSDTPLDVLKDAGFNTLCYRRRGQGRGHSGGGGQGLSRRAVDAAGGRPTIGRHAGQRREALHGQR